MYVGWTKHLSEDKDKEAFKGQIWRSRHVLNRVKDLIEIEEKAIDDTERDPKAYVNPAWPYMQAYKNGMRHGLSIIKQFVDLTKQQKPKENER